MHVALPVAEASQPSAARYGAQDVAREAGFDDTDIHRAGIVATELATNLVKHTAGAGGEILLRVASASPPEIEILSIDRGPGMRDVAQCLVDGHSTAGSPGTGLGAVRRLSDDFDVFSQLGRGTVVLARLRAGRAAPRRNGFAVGGVSVPFRGEPVCGDAWHVTEQGRDGLVVVVADGLGHGVHAAEAATAAIATVTARPFSGAAAALEAIHDGIRHTRGAAATVAELRKSSEVIVVSGIGNVSAVIWTPTGVRQVATQNGTLGHQARHFREFSYPWTPEGLFVLHSDGLTSRWSLDEYPGIRNRHPSIVAAVLYRDYSRRRDDVTVVVGRESV